MSSTASLDFDHAYRDHHRSVHAAAFRILHNSAQAQNVVQDVFLRLWRRPDRFDAGRGDLGGYLRMMGRSRALDVWREGQALGRADDRLKLVVDRSEPPVEGRPAAEAEDGMRERTGRLVGRAVASVANLLDLRLAVVAGSVALGFGDAFFHAAQAELDRSARLDFSRGARIVAGGLGADGALIGAAKVGLRETRR